MSENSKIEWTDHTFNPWIGCTKISPGCAHCYAETQNKLRRWNKAGWGKGIPRQRTKTWGDPVKWNAQPMQLTADGKGHRRARVFCASLADWLDDEVPIEWLADLLHLIESTPNLDWLLLTKRPQNWRARIEAVEGYLNFPGDTMALSWLHGIAPGNVWIGTTVEDQQRADERIPHLLQIPAKVRFLSCEPLLGPVDIRTIRKVDDWSFYDRPLSGKRATKQGDYVDPKMPRINWVIAGGESGPGARPMHPEWARGLRDQCVAAGVAFLFKQWGEWAPGANFEHIPSGTAHNFGDGSMDDSKMVWRVGKKAAGRTLDGQEHSEFPATESEVSK